MIVVNLMGGLGNQMFQYAAGRQLAVYRNTELYLDLTFLNADSKGAYTQRYFELDVFNIKAKIATDDILKKFNASNDLFSRISRKLSPSSEFVRVNEAGHRYNAGFKGYPENTYLNGYWQCEKYFEEIRSELLREFTPKNIPDNDTQQMILKIRSVNSVSLHIRRGDYASLESAKKYHGLLPISYYYDSIKEIEKTVKTPEFFVFSDDINWASENLKLEHPANFVKGHQGTEAYKDLWLMCHCKHNIIANSSFSWWAAWLNQNTTKKVMAPGQWALDPAHDFADIYAKGFNRI